MTWTDRTSSKNGKSAGRSEWVSRCDKCGELLATDKSSLVAAHQRLCAEAYEEPPRHGGTGALAILALAGMAMGAILSMFAVI
jgi:hypothetical protein